MPEFHSSISRSRLLVKVIVALTVALILAAAAAIWALRQGAITDAEDDNHRLGVVLAEQTTRTFQAVDFVLREFADKIVSTRIDDLNALHNAFGGLDVHEALVKRLNALPQAGSFAILDSTGHLVNQTRQWPNSSVTFADRSYFQHFATEADPAAWLSEPVVSRAGGSVRTVVLARRLSAPDGSFLGIVFAGMELAYFDAFFAKIGFSDGTGITILRDDGVFFARFPPRSMLAGTRMPARSAWYETLRAGGGNYQSPGVLDDMGIRLVSVHPLTEYRVVVDVTRLRSAVLTRWLQQATAISGGLMIVTMGFAVLLVALMRQITILGISQVRIGEQVNAARGSEAHLAAQSALLETTLEHMDQGLIMVDGSGIVAVCNRRATEILELPAEMMMARPRITDVIKFQTLNGEFEDTRDHPPNSLARINDRAMYERRRPNGTMIEVRSAPLPGGGMVRTYADITARTAAEEMLGIAASHDQLTGLFNRNGFSAKRQSALAAARREGRELAVLCLDLDRFKAVNDTHGHDAGDQLLVLVSQRMNESTRSADVVARLGGDEFAIILPNTNAAGAEEMSRRLLETIRLPYTIAGEQVRIGVSIGVAIYPYHGETSEELLRNADAALYKAKAAGRDTWRTYASEDGQRQHERLALELDFRTAVATGQFALVYQPICDSGTGSPVAYEALVRWNHPTRGLISPADFIPIAEQTGLIIPLGHWIFETACAEAATWAVPVRIAVNLSPAQFRERDLVGFVRETLAATGLSPARLDLEVTEGLLLEDAEDVVMTMNALRAMGIRMVLDDFGTAHSSLSYLRGFPFECVKIDQSFMRALTTDGQARALVEAILAMARALGLEVIGEGVETPGQLEVLRQLQCPLVQGYLLGRPAAAPDTREAVWNLAASNPPNGVTARALVRV